MSTCIIELNDINLFTTVASGQYHESPGFALLNGDEVLVGTAAQAAARLHPRQINNRFWQQLGLNPLPTESHQVRHHADLAYRHLQHIQQLAGAPEQIVFAVPASFDRDQLAVLLGITQQCPFDAVGLVDLSVAAAAGIEIPGSGVHLDIQLHQAVVTAFKLADGNVTRSGERIVEGQGMLALYTQFAHLIADAFIQQCRFDPLHDAHSEQLLYDALPEWLQQGSHQQEFVFAIPQDDTVHTAKLSRAAFLQPVRQLQQRLQASAEGLTDDLKCRLITQNLLMLPGFFELVENGIAVPAGAVADACWQHEALICTAAASLPFVTSLPATVSEQPQRQVKPPVNVPTRPAATHILLDSTAYAVTENTQYLHSDGNGGLALTASKNTSVQAGLSQQQQQIWLHAEPGATVLVNDQAAQQQQALLKGDRLSLSRGGPYALVIELHAAHGTQT